MHHQGHKLHPILEPVEVQSYHTLGHRHQHRVHTFRAKYQHISIYRCINHRVSEQRRQVTCVHLSRANLGQYRQRPSYAATRQGRVFQIHHNIIQQTLIQEALEADTQVRHL